MGGATHLALLRGINVGGKNALPMADLARLFSAAGCSDLRTYIQSGNVVFRAERALAARIPGLIATAVRKRFGFAIPVVMRSLGELRGVAERNPFLRPGVDPQGLHVGFLAERPGADAVAALDPARSPPDRFAVVEREIFLHCPDGMGRSKLTNAWFDRALSTTSTMRNWRTVLELLALMGER